MEEEVHAKFREIFWVDRERKSKKMVRDSTEKKPVSSSFPSVNDIRASSSQDIFFVFAFDMDQAGTCFVHRSTDKRAISLINFSDVMYIHL